MKASIKLIKSKKNNQNQHPIYLKLADGNKRSFKIIAHIEQFFWDFENCVPFKQYPDFNLLMPSILEYQAKCYKINYGNYTFQQAKSILMHDANLDIQVSFFNAGLKYANSTKTGKLNRTILNSWNSMYPNVTISEITDKHVKRYMMAMLKTNRPNGVHTYIRKLSTIYSKLTDASNPFKGIRPKKQKTRQKTLTKIDLHKIFTTCTLVNKFDGKNTNETINYDRYYYMLMFYLGGIDMVDLANLRYDIHVVQGRIQFYRHKGGTDCFVNNKIMPEAMELLNRFDCYPYLVPIYKYKDYHSFVNKVNKRFSNKTLDLVLTRKPLTKSARYSFINLAQQLLIDQRITMEIVGHMQTSSTHSIYTDEFPMHVRDEAHRLIIDSIK